MDNPGTWNLFPLLTKPPPKDIDLDSLPEQRSYYQEFKRCYDELMVFVRSVAKADHPSVTMRAGYQKLGEIHSSLCKHLADLRRSYMCNASPEIIKHFKAMEWISKNTNNTSLHRLVLPGDMSEGDFLGHFVQAKDSYRLMRYFIRCDEYNDGERFYRMWLVNYQTLLCSYGKWQKAQLSKTSNESRALQPSSSPSVPPDSQLSSEARRIEAIMDALAECTKWRQHSASANTIELWEEGSILHEGFNGGMPPDSPIPCCHPESS